MHISSSRSPTEVCKDSLEVWTTSQHRAPNHSSKTTLLPIFRCIPQLMTNGCHRLACIKATYCSFPLKFCLQGSDLQTLPSELNMCPYPSKIDLQRFTTMLQCPQDKGKSYCRFYSSKLFQ
ncbi:hypothetical protein O6H91_06G068200 [Diphasiastrum complanatum]|uniref:Uncharacterized protein n=1 Tax=Diphasiastrum complanatum TaxID=34168 RepID=A0ACC2DER7_DIPCM|nr:hypothetical protein O6H91_06G068200 [Diphasiastrum complanatum]